jgi:hypothetical protein
MSSDLTMEKKLPLESASPVDVDSDTGSTTQTIYIDPAKEKAAFRKFDKYVLPVSIIFMVLSSLDRNNVSQVLLIIEAC